MVTIGVYANAIIIFPFLNSNKIRKQILSEVLVILRTF